MSRPLAATGAFRPMCWGSAPFTFSASMRPLTTSSSRLSSRASPASVLMDINVHGPVSIKAQLQVQFCASRRASALTKSHIQSTSPFGVGSLQVQIRHLSTTSPRRQDQDKNQDRNPNQNQDAEKDPRAVGRSGRRPGQDQISTKQLSVLQILGHALRGAFRMLFMPFRGEVLRKTYKTNPVGLVAGLVVVFIVAVMALWTVYLYFTYFNGPRFTRYPPEVANYLRRAIYFSNYAQDVKRAHKNYKLALQKVEELHLDPFSDDVMGIRIEIAAWLFRIENYHSAIGNLELLLADCRKWMTLMEQDEKDVAEGKVQPSAKEYKPRLAPYLKTGIMTPDGKLPPELEDDPVKNRETVYGRRTRLLKKCVGISMKLGELYADPHVRQADKAHEHLLWAVNTTLGEFHRRETQGLKDGEGDWMTPDEMGASLEALGHNYESRSQFEHALPLFFQALRVSSDPCHSAVLMNNLAICFAQHPVVPPYETLAGPVLDEPRKGHVVTRAEAQKAFYETAHRWAANALQHAKDTPGELRTDECDHSCAVALCNLGDISALLGDKQQAIRRFKEARDVSTSLGFQDGVLQAEAGLGRLQK